MDRANGLSTLDRKRTQLRNEISGLRRLAFQAAKADQKTGDIPQYLRDALERQKQTIEDTKAVIAELEAGEAQ